MNRRFTHVFFDFTNTLVRLRDPVGELYARVAARHGLEVEASVVQERFDAAIASIPQPVEPGLPPDVMAARERQWWSDLAAAALSPLDTSPRFAAFFDEVFESYRHADAWELLPGVRDTLRALRENGRRSSVISDMDARVHDIFEVLDLAAEFESVCLSFRTGYAKPDPRLYEAAMQRAGATPQHCVHVGDSIAKDVEPALATGMLAIHLDAADGGTPAGAHGIRALRELPALLRRIEESVAFGAAPPPDHTVS